MHLSFSVILHFQSPESVIAAHAQDWQISLINELGVAIHDLQVVVYRIPPPGAREEDFRDAIVHPVYVRPRIPILYGGGMDLNCFLQGPGSYAIDIVTPNISTEEVVKFGVKSGKTDYCYTLTKLYTADVLTNTCPGEVPPPPVNSDLGAGFYPPY